MVTTTAIATAAAATTTDTTTHIFCLGRDIPCRRCRKLLSR